MRDQTKIILIQDMNAIKKEISENSRLFVQNVIKSLKLKKMQPFSEYKVDLSLFYLKQLHERIFPHTKHGAQLIAKFNKMNFKVIRGETDQVTESVTFRNSVSLHDRSIIINLLEGVKIQGRVPSFVKIISARSSLSRGTIQNRIRVGNYIANCTEANESLMLFRSNKISRTKFLEEIKKKKKLRI